MMKPKGPLDASTYTKWIRQRTNIGMKEKVPTTDLPALGLLTQLGNLRAASNVPSANLVWFMNAFFSPTAGNIIRQVTADSYGTVYATNIIGATVGTVNTIEILRANNTTLSVNMPAADIQPNSLDIYNNKLYVGCTSNQSTSRIIIYDITPGVGITLNKQVTSFSGTTLINPRALVVSPTGTVYFVINGNVLLKTTDILTASPTASVVNNNAVAATKINSPDCMYLVVENGVDMLYMSNIGGNNVVKVNSSLGTNDIPMLIAGTGVAGYNNTDNVLAVFAQLNGPRGIFVDTNGDVYIGDTINGRVRKVDIATGIITTFAGTGVSGNTGDGGLATSAQVSGGNALGVSGVYYSTYYKGFLIADTNNKRVRQIKLN